MAHRAGFTYSVLMSLRKIATPHHPFPWSKKLLAENQFSNTHCTRYNKLGNNLKIEFLLFGGNSESKECFYPPPSQAPSAAGIITDPPSSRLTKSAGAMPNFCTNCHNATISACSVRSSGDCNIFSLVPRGAAVIAISFHMIRAAMAIVYCHWT